MLILFNRSSYNFVNIFIFSWNCSFSLNCVLSEETPDTNSIIFDMIRPVNEPTIYSTQDKASQPLHHSGPALSQLDQFLPIWIGPHVGVIYFQLFKYT
jgi:hypothetical protein